MKIPTSIAIAFLSSAIASQATDRFRLDFDNSVPAPPDNTQAGWEAFSETAEANNKSEAYPGYPGLASGDITITTSGVLFTRNYNNAGAAAPNFPGTTLDKVCNDLIGRNNADSTLDVEIAGLLAGTYQITTHHLVAASTEVDTAEFDLHVQDADSPAFGQLVGNFAMGKSDVGPTVVVFTVVSNGSDPVVLRIAGTYFNPAGGTLNWVGINSLEVAIPAPPLQLDFSTDAGTQAGWETLGGGGDAASHNGTYAGYPDLADGDITVTVTGLEFNRGFNNGTGAGTDFTGTDLDAMYADLLLRNDPDATINVTIAGLKAGTYQITTHHLINSPSPGTFNLAVQDSDSPGFGQNVGDFVIGTGSVGVTPTFNPRVITFDVVSNGTDPIVLRMTEVTPSSGGNTGGWFGINGLEISIPPPFTNEFQLVITPNADNPGNYDFAWNSLADKVYDLVSATDLDTPPATWAVWNGNAGIAATPGTNTLTNVPGGGDPKRFFAVVEKDAPPSP